MAQGGLAGAGGCAARGHDRRGTAHLRGGRGAHVGARRRRGHQRRGPRAWHRRARGLRRSGLRQSGAAPCGRVGRPCCAPPRSAWRSGGASASAEAVPPPLGRPDGAAARRGGRAPGRRRDGRGPSGVRAAAARVGGGAGRPHRRWCSPEGRRGDDSPRRPRRRRCAAGRVSSHALPHARHFSHSASSRATSAGVAASIALLDRLAHCPGGAAGRRLRHCAHLVAAPAWRRRRRQHAWGQRVRSVWPPRMLAKRTSTASRSGRATRRRRSCRRRRSTRTTIFQMWQGTMGDGMTTCDGRALCR